MPALDPFSALSRPMLSFDALPSRPLQFAETLHPIDLNSVELALPVRLPKPLRAREAFPKQYPVPPYNHSRSVSASLVVRRDLTDISFRPVVDGEDIVGNDEWMQAQVARCVDLATGDLDIRCAFSR